MRYDKAMTLKLCEIISLLLLIGVSGMYWGPWLAVSRSFASFEPEVLLPLMKRMGENMGPLMTALVPLALLSTVPVLFFSFGKYPTTFYLTLTSLVLFIVTLLVTVLIEVPLVGQFASWTTATLPNDWRARRDRWVGFHLLRVVPSVVGVVLLLVAAVFSPG